MNPQTLLARTARGTALHKYNEGFLVCDPDGQCNFCTDLYNAEELVRELDRKYDYPYSTGFHEIMH
jgi:hypothetical protein|tara:strand:+ start:481 stop:678 length:198 start_codon:yes stop_codon:yes gene_type:complete